MQLAVTWTRLSDPVICEYPYDSECGSIYPTLTVYAPNKGVFRFMLTMPQHWRIICLLVLPAQPHSPTNSVPPATPPLPPLPLSATSPPPVACPLCLSPVAAAASTVMTLWLICQNCRIFVGGVNHHSQPLNTDQYPPPPTARAIHNTYQYILT